VIETFEPRRIVVLIVVLFLPWRNQVATANEYQKFAEKNASNDFGRFRAS